MPSSSAGEILGNNNHEPASLPVKQDSPTAPPVQPEQGCHSQVRRRHPDRLGQVRPHRTEREGWTRFREVKFQLKLPLLSRLTVNADAIRVADVVLIPCKPRVWDAWACEDIVAAVKLRQDANRGWQRELLVAYG